MSTTTMIMSPTWDSTCVPLSSKTSAETCQLSGSSCAGPPELVVPVGEGDIPRIVWRGAALLLVHAGMPPPSVTDVSTLSPGGALGRERSASAGTGSSGRAADVRYPKVNGGVAGGEAAHGRQFLHRGGQGGLDRGDLAEPALFCGLLEPVAQAGVDLFKTRHLSWVHPKERAPDAGVFVRTWGAVVAAADAERDFP